MKKTMVLLCAIIISLTCLGCGGTGSYRYCKSVTFATANSSANYRPNYSVCRVAEFIDNGTKEKLYTVNSVTSKTTNSGYNIAEDSDRPTTLTPVTYNDSEYEFTRYVGYIYNSREIVEYSETTRIVKYTTHNGYSNLNVPSDIWGYMKSRIVYQSFQYYGNELSYNYVLIDSGRFDNESVCIFIDISNSTFIQYEYE